MDWDTFALLGRTFASVFPRGSLLKIGPVDYLLVAHRDGGALDWETVEKNIRHARRSSNADFHTAGFLSRLVVTEDLEALFGEGPVHSDDLPLLEFAAPRQLFSGHLDIGGRAAEVRSLNDGTLRVLAGQGNTGALLDLVAFAGSVNAPLFSLVDYQHLDPAAQERYLSLVRSFCTRESVPCYTLFGHPEPRRVCAEIQMRRIAAHMAEGRPRAADHYNLGLAMIAAGLGTGAEASLKRALGEDPRNTGCLTALGLLCAEAGRFKEAAGHFGTVASLRPDDPEAHAFLGMVMARQGLWDEAVSSLSEALDLAPADVTALKERARVHLATGRLEAASDDFRSALGLAPGDTEALNGMALTLLRKGRREEAATFLVRALETDPGNEVLRGNLDLVLAGPGGNPVPGLPARDGGPPQIP
jgi:spermidine synthase